jgi:predicted lipid-binding transport protein (Tim44 family)
MEPVDALLPLVQLLMSIAICVVPIVLVVGVIVVLVVVLARRKPQAASQTKPAAKPKPTPRAEAAPQPKAEPAPAAKAVMVEEIATKSCPSCGADNPADNAFCEYCGASLAEE